MTPIPFAAPTVTTAHVSPLRAAIERDHALLARLIRLTVYRCCGPVRPRDLDDIADETLNETVRRALAAEERFDPDRPAVPWLMAIAANVLIDRRRGLARSHARVVTQTDLGDDTWDAIARVADSAPARDTGLDVRAALAKLKAADRRVIELRFFQGMIDRELAAALGISDGAARVRLCRAMKALTVVLTAGKGVTP